MTFSYEPLWNLIEKKGIENKTDLKVLTKITSSTLSKLSKNEFVSMDVIDRICDALDCQISEVVTHVKTKENNGPENVSPDALNIVSLFSGIGGFEVGMNTSNFKGNVVFSSEIDKFAQTSYTSNFPFNNLNGDITKVDEKVVPDHDLLMGGFPCQAFSIAGTRNGFDDIRGTLFFDVARILKQKKPKYVLLENVKNLVSHDKSKTIKVILKTLNDLGYTVDFTVLNSKEAGLPQNRERTYIIGILNGPSEKFEKDCRSKKIQELKIVLNEEYFYGFNFFNQLKFDEEQKYIQDILEKDVKEKYYIGSEELGKYCLNFSEEIKSKEVAAKIMKIFDIPKEILNDNERQRRVYSDKGLAPTILARSDSAKVVVYDNNKFRVRKLTPIENLRVQGYDEVFIEKLKESNVSDTQLYKQSGNAVSPPVIKGILDQLDYWIINNKCEKEKEKEEKNEQLQFY